MGEARRVVTVLHSPTQWHKRPARRSPPWRLLGGGGRGPRGSSGSSGSTGLAWSVCHLLIANVRPSMHARIKPCRAKKDKGALMWVRPGVGSSGSGRAACERGCALPP